MQKKLDYAQEEVRVFKKIIEVLNGKKRFPFTDEQRRRLAVLYTLDYAKIMSLASWSTIRAAA